MIKFFSFNLVCLTISCWNVKKKKKKKKKRELKIKWTNFSLIAREKWLSGTTVKGTQILCSF